LWKIIAYVLTFAKSIFNVQQPEYISAPCSVSFALVADSTESNVMIRTRSVKDIISNLCTKNICIQILKLVSSAIIREVWYSKSESTKFK